MEIVVLASGQGSLFEAICSRSEDLGYKCIRLVVSKDTCGAVKVAKSFAIPVMSAEDFFVDPIPASLYVLAGFLKKVPDTFTNSFGGKTINSHPSLLPKFGGKGMYGRRVHEAVIEAGERESGFSIHYVNEQYDSGEMIFQERISVEPGDTAESLEAKIKSLEAAAYPRVISELLAISP